MTEEERIAITSNEFIDLIVEYRGNTRLLDEFSNDIIHIMNEEYAMVYLPIERMGTSPLSFPYAEVPIPFTITQSSNLDASGVNQLRRLSNFNLRGEGVLIAIVDTGIDYTNPVFLRADGSTKIVSIWDQSIDSGVSPMNTEFGSEYSQEDINRALASDDPYSIVPSRDVIGHGTMMAAVAAGNEVPSENFYGVAPNAELIIVKLRDIKQNLREFFRIPQDSICFQENHIMWGLQYCYYKARELRKPVVITTGCGSSFAGHEGRAPINVMGDVIADTPNVAVVYPVGNEGNLGRHFYGVIDEVTRSSTVEFNVGESDTGFTMTFWGNSPGLFSIDIQSPSGEYVPRLPQSINLSRIITFIFEPTIINVDFQSIESQTGDELILLRFSNITPGIWKMNVYEQSGLTSSFHIWLPMGTFISTDTYFVQPNIYTTLLSPATSDISIAITAYNPANNNLYVNAGRGFTRNDYIKPELAAPGVNYIAPTAEKTFTTYTGTSVAAAHASGIAALVFEWGTVRGNRFSMDSISIKNFLIRGANRRDNMVYPNREWGYGIIDLYNSFNVLREEA